MNDRKDIRRLLDLMATLRDPQRGCPWDREQSFASIAPYTIEEAYEVADAIERRDVPALRDELGDLLFQVVFHARMAEEQGSFDFGEVVAAICDKMERRHPHVFGTERIGSSDEQTIAWEEHKRRERQAKQAVDPSVLHDVPIGLPALTRAVKLGKRASSVGFDWPDDAGAFDKIEEELREIRAAAGGSTADLEGEIGDVLFAIGNVCRHLKIDPELALRRTNAKFEQRFHHIERRLRQQGRTPQQSTLAEMDGLWEEAKRGESC